jgi:hypothetical protein
MSRAYKIVQSDAGPTVAHLIVPESAVVIKPHVDDSHFRADRLLVEFLENMETMGWGPVDERTVYSVGEVTEVDDLDEDEEVVSGAGLHAFGDRGDALRWMEQAEI